MQFFTYIYNTLVTIQSHVKMQDILCDIVKMFHFQNNPIFMLTLKKKQFILRLHHLNKI